MKAGSAIRPAPPTLSDDFAVEQLLQKHCIDTHLYLQHDLNRAQVAKAIGTNRTYLSLYFMRQETTYNAYINDLRIRHFIRLYREAIAAERPVTAQQLALMSGYRSYSTFSLAFKQRMGQSVTTWMRQMSQLEPLIADLALILICAGVMTLLFKSLKQPIVLGYIVAGFLASPNMPYMPSVTDGEGVHVWSEIGVIFLLFALGLEFSFKKILKMGAAPIIAACTIILCMMYVGAFTGQLFGWSQMDCIFLGGMLAMSSTTIIFKAFDDMGLRQQRFAGLVLSVLIIEDILAIVLMVMLSTLAVSKEFEGTQMLLSLLQLGFFLVLWFVVGIYLIPLFLRKLKPLMNDETLLITALALCFGMVVAASAAGFSAAFGAFVMGSILAETVEAEQIEHLVAPVKNLFGAIFFVSVGMMVDVALIGRVHRAHPLHHRRHHAGADHPEHRRLPAGRPAAEDLHAVLVLADADWRVRLHPGHARHVARCHQRLPLPHRRGRVGLHHVHHALHDSPGRARLQRGVAAAARQVDSPGERSALARQVNRLRPAATAHHRHLRQLFRGLRHSLVQLARHLRPRSHHGHHLLPP